MKLQNFITSCRQQMDEKEMQNLELDSAQENYVPPPQKSVSEIFATDANDESLNRYKQALLGQAKSGQVIVDPTDPRNVLVRSITLVVEGHPDITMHLDKGYAQFRIDQSLHEIAEHLNEASFVIKEGAAYRIRFDFHVQREICTGLKYIQKVTRHSITVDKETFMMGSYAPKMEMQSFITPLDEAPSGILHRGTYKIKSQICDDDGHDWLSWTWSLEIAKDWGD
ncbi:RHO protein GDP dissociation inhibitor [Onchocerca flexuosa]|uniref:RHO protein GDP dissociation inhibitor n=1 Tax=Onchocerca flexuosa TaxID=387005 RepID=A0A238BJ77_9BILA|nr:RHO protein GDP dissociation inhibitor [Onchocerca flexuosa]